MATPVRRNIKKVLPPAAEGAKIRSWREKAEQEGRDRRPGHFSVTGEFIQLDGSAEGPRERRET